LENNEVDDSLIKNADDTDDEELNLEGLQNKAAKGG